MILIFIILSCIGGIISLNLANYICNELQDEDQLNIIKKNNSNK